MKVLLFGGTTGMLSQDLLKVCKEQNIACTAIGRTEVDIFSINSISEVIKKSNPSHIINTIAWTQVDDAEESIEAVYKVNVTFPEYLATICAELDIELIHYSTDFVFDGNTVAPYREDSPTAPLSVYGSTKLAGEETILESSAKAYTIRTAWLFGIGRENFISKILKILESKGTVSVVADNYSTPTSTLDLARATFSLLDKNPSYGIYNIVNGGEASWYSLASYSAECFREYLPTEYSVIPVLARSFSQKAERPRYSVLDTSLYSSITGICMPHWRTAVKEYVNKYIEIRKNSV